MLRHSRCLLLLSARAPPAASAASLRVPVCSPSAATARRHRSTGAKAGRDWRDQDALDLDSAKPRPHFGGAGAAVGSRQDIDAVVDDAVCALQSQVVRCNPVLIPACVKPCPCRSR